MRLFFALWPPPATASALEAWALALQQQTGGRVIPAASIHLTLAFLGEADPARAVAAARSVRASAHALPLEQPRYVRRNRMIWARPRATPERLAGLAGALKGALEAARFPLEDRPFSPHVTLIRKAAEPRTLPALPIVSWPVEAFALMASETTRDGARYRQLASIPLSAGSGSA